MKIKVYNQEGNAIGERELDPEVFGLKINKSLVHQVFVAQTANARQVLAHTKDKSEVRGGGRKPWRQKGTGRARHGSSRSPIWRGGGVTFGPTRERVFKQKINKKMKQRAIQMCLSDRASTDHFIVLDKLEASQAKTKEMAAIFSRFPIKEHSTLVAFAKKDDKVVRSMANLSKVDIIAAANLNVFDLLKHEYLLTTLDGLEKINEVFKTKQGKEPEEAALRNF